MTATALGHRRQVTRWLGRQLRARREALGLSTRAVARELGTSHALVIRWEAGHHAPHVETLVDLAALYHVSLCELFGGDEPLRMKARSLEAQIHQMPALARPTGLQVLEALLEGP